MRKCRKCKEEMNSHKHSLCRYCFLEMQSDEPLNDKREDRFGRELLPSDTIKALEADPYFLSEQDESERPPRRKRGCDG